MASSREEEYLKALDIAKSTFLSHDSKERCRIAGAEWESHPPGSIVRLPFFKDLCRITVPDFEFSFQENQPPITLGLALSQSDFDPPLPQWCQRHCSGGKKHFL